MRKSTGALAKLIRAKHKAAAARAEAQENRRAALSVLIEEREADRRNRANWRAISVKPERRPIEAPARKRGASHRPTRSGWLAGASVLPSYSGPVIDRMCRRGVFFRVRYYGQSSKPGVGRRATNYIVEGAYETADGRLMFFSNVGETPEEAMAALELVEQLNRAAQANGKALFHAIANVPFQLDTEAMFEIGRRFAEHQFGSRDLPFAVALHPPSKEGDQRNWHLHILFSTRPMVRTDAYQWDVGEMLRREIDNPAAFERMRALYADVQTEVAQEAGLNFTYTALSNAARGLPIAPQEHLGGARTDMARRGEEVAANDRNWDIMLAGEAALIDQQLRHAAEAASAQQSAMERALGRFALTLPTISPGTVPAVALSISRAAPIGRVPRPSSIALPRARADGLALTPPVSNLKPAVRALGKAPQPSKIDLPRDPRPSAISAPLTGPDLSGERRRPRADLPQPSRIESRPASPLRLSRALANPRPLTRPPLSAGPSPSSLPADPRIPAPIALSSALSSAHTPRLDVGSSRPSGVVQANPPAILSVQLPMRPATAPRGLKLPPRLSAIPPAAFGAPEPLSLSLSASAPAAAQKRARAEVRAETPQVSSDREARERAAADLDLLFEQATARRRALKSKKAADAAQTQRLVGGLGSPGETLEARLRALRRQDQWVADHGEDGLSVTDEARRAAGLSPEEMRTEPVQHVLRALADSQYERLAPVIDAFGNPPVVRTERDGLILSERFPAALRADFKRWASSPDFRGLVDRVWPATAPYPAPPGEAAQNPHTAPVCTAGSAATQAQRVSAMVAKVFHGADWAVAEHPSANESVPAIVIDLPVAVRSADEVPSQPGERQSDNAQQAATERARRAAAFAEASRSR